ncbi:MAG TPA: ATP-binding protein [Ktedonobacteraceae bacterium]|jgi:two-component system sensor histidine kinase KdpD|nr:ATP-binding protein [Ktedonobacteraceae bacterium]
MNWLERFRLSLLEIKQEQRGSKIFVDSVVAVLGALVVTFIIYFFHLYPRIPNISLLYIVVVLALASTRGLYAAVLTSIVAFLSFDYFLVPPYYTLSIAKIDEWLALFIFLVTAIITGQLASALRKRAEQARRREYETRILYELVRDMNREENLQRQLDIIVHGIADNFSSWGVRDCAIFLPDSAGRLVLQESAREPAVQVNLLPDEEATAAWVMAQSQTVELHDVALNPPQLSVNAPRAVVRSTRHGQVARHYIRLIPLKLGQKVVGVLRLSMEDDPQLFAAERSLGVEQERSNPRMAFFWAFVDQAAVAIERARLRHESLRVQVLQRTDELRAALLSSVSHDLRTPLSAIKAAASSLLQEDVQWDEEARRGFALSIEREADRLNRLVENLLDMSRIEGGALKPEKEWYPVDELVHDVLGRLQPDLRGREVILDLPASLPPVKLDYMEIDQVLTNIIENAVDYSPAGSPIEISAKVDSDQMVVSVADRGPGIPPDDLVRIFDKFYRIRNIKTKSPRTSGSGLGLAVSRGMVEAHGGRIWAENREGGGSIFRFTLPLGKTERVLLHE